MCEWPNFEEKPWPCIRWLHPQNEWQSKSAVLPKRYDKGHVAALVRSHMNGLLFLPDGYVKLTRPNKVETAVHGCHCPGDTAVRMRKVMARPWVGVLVYHHSRPQSLLLACGRNRELWGQPFWNNKGNNRILPIRFHVVCICGACLKWLLPELSIPAAGQKDRRLWGREWCITCFYCCFYRNNAPGPNGSKFKFIAHNLEKT